MKEQILEILKKLENSGDVDFYEYDGILHITLNDFYGFDEDFNEVYRDYEDGDSISKLFDLLDMCPLIEGDFYKYYTFSTDFIIQLGYTSFDI